MEEEKNVALWRLYYHLIWATKERQALIIAAIEPKLYGYKRMGKAHALVASFMQLEELRIIFTASLPFPQNF